MQRDHHVPTARRAPSRVARDQLEARLLSILTPEQLKALADAWQDIPLESRSWALAAAQEAVDEHGAGNVSLAGIPHRGLLESIGHTLAVRSLSRDTRQQAITAAAAAVLGMSIDEGLFPRQREVLLRAWRQVVCVD